MSSNTKVRVTLEFEIKDSTRAEFPGIEIIDDDGFCVLRKPSTEEALQALREVIIDSGIASELEVQLINVIGGDPA